MMKACDICLEKECKSTKGEGNCNCETCAVKDVCNKKLSATIRITLKCTQSCSHCCFESSPSCETHMSIDTANSVAMFLTANEVRRVNLMGGEIFCHPSWKEILDIIVPSANHVRIVSNGDWARHCPEFAQYLSKFKNCYVSISKDRWHTNLNVERAVDLLKASGVLHTVSDLDEKEENMVPVGRSEYNYGFYSMFSCYCRNPERMYSFLIDEVGDIFKCSFGVWKYDNIFDYVEGGFSSRFKDFNKRFYSIFIPSCQSCVSAYNSYTIDEKISKKVE